MEGSVSNVQFTERKKGFDPDEVANYLHQIDDKIAGLRAMASQAVERAELAEERARQAEQATASDSDDGDGAARAANVLAMAQRTADATVSEARTEAARLLAAATTEADQQSAAAEAQAQQVLAEARREMETARTEHLDTLRLDVAELEQSRSAILAEIDVLARTLDAERFRMREAAAALLDLADSPTGMAAAAAVDGASAPSDDGGASHPIDDSGELVGLTVEPSGDVEYDAGPNPDPGAGPNPGPNLGHDAGDEGPVVAQAGDAQAGDDQVGGVSVDDVPVGDEPHPTESTGGGGDTAAVPETNALSVDALSADALSVDPDATAAVSGLFDDDDDDDIDGEGLPAGLLGESADAEGSEPVTGGGYGGSYGAGRVGDESSLGSGTDSDDEAMRAFFERDEDDDSGGSRWGRRRR